MFKWVNRLLYVAVYTVLLAGVIESDSWFIKSLSVTCIAVGAYVFSRNYVAQ